MPDRHAVLFERGGRSVLRFERLLGHPRERVWHALTDRAELEAWHPTPFRIAGEEVEFLPSPDAPDFPAGRLLALEEPALLAYTWGEDELRWTLSERADGCLLTLEHSFADRFKAARDGAGWHVCLIALGSLLHGGAVPGKGSARELPAGWQELNDDYQRRFAIAPEEATPVPELWALRRRGSLPHVADWSTIASLATAGGTLILAIATFGSTRSANRAARASEEALMVGVRPVLFNARPDDRAQKVGFIDNHWLRLRDGLAAVQEQDGRVYLAMPLRNVAQGIAVLHGWYLHPERAGSEVPPAELEDFHRHMRDLYVPAGDVNFWQAAIRDPDDPLYGPLKAAIARRDGISVDLLYGDHEGGQRTITRFFLSPREQAADDEPWLWLCAVVRHWNLDRADPR